MPQDKYELPDFLESSIRDYFEEDAEITLLIHGRDRGLYAFPQLVSDPIVYKGWVSFAVRELGQTKNVMFPASNFAYLSYYAKERKPNG